MIKLTSTLAAILISLSLLSYNPSVSTAAPMIDPVVSQGLTSPQTPKADNPLPPSTPVKLIFIHHSTGGNWLAAPESNGIGGDLGQALMNNSYYVSATNYGWGPNTIGDRTDIGHWWDWFRGTSSATYTAALYMEYDQNIGSFGDWPRLATDPGGENKIIVIKSCFPNSNLGGSPTDTATVGDNPMRGAPAGDSSYTVANAKGIYNDLLVYFATRQDKLFIVVTAPPLASGVTNATQAANARALNNWLVNDWLYAYPYTNVAVFDFYNVLTSIGTDSDTSDVNSEIGNHHRSWSSAVQHLQTLSNNYSSYPLSSSDSHPNDQGNLKATAEFVQLLNIYYHRWAEASPTAVTLASFSEGPLTNGVQLNWSTASEVGLLGFNLYRSDELAGVKHKLNADLIPAQTPGDLLGNSYQFTDGTAVSGNTYLYWVELVMLDGNQLSDPVILLVPYWIRLPLVIR